MFGRLLGQDTARATLRRALRNDRVHHAYRFEGPPGVGKELCALGLASALLCDARTSEGDGCGSCDACVRVLAVTTEEPHVPLHPDVLLVARALYPAAVIGRSTNEKQDISVHQIRKVVLAHIPYPPHEGRARVIIVRDADELNLSAANALLKTLEEPPARTHFVLLTARSGDLLDTILSRTLRLRFAPLGDETMRTLLSARGISAPEIERVLPLAAGSVSSALAALDPESSRERDAFVDGMIAAISATDLRPAMAVAAARHKEKDVLRSHLTALAARLATLARASVVSGSGEEACLAGRFEAVTRALSDLDRNVAPQLVLEALAIGLRAVPA